MRTRSMEETIGRRLYLMGFLSLVVAVAVCIFVFHQAFTKQAWRALENESSLITAQYRYDPDSLQALDSDRIRVTLISPSGEVLYESTDADEQAEMENHLSRPEVQEAFAAGQGEDIRDSATTGYETYYYAVLLEDGNVLRTSQDAETVWALYDQALPAILISCFVIMGSAAFLAGVLTRHLVRPMLKMTDDLDHIQENVPYRELVPFADAIYSDRAMRESNEKMRQEFTANVSHELKTPLTSISGYAEMIETGLARPEDVASFGQKIHSEASRMLRLVNDIIQLSHLDASGSTHDAPVMEPVDLSVIARECAERLPRRPRDGAGGPVGHRAGVRRAPEGERPAGLRHPELPGRERPGQGLPQPAGRALPEPVRQRHPLQPARGPGPAGDRPHPGGPPLSLGAGQRHRHPQRGPGQRL